MANAAMETTEDVRVPETQEGNPNWSEEMDRHSGQDANTNEDEIQRTPLIAPPGDDELEIPEAIERMMNNGVKFRQSIGSWKIDDEKVTVRKSYPVIDSKNVQNSQCAQFAILLII